jgi:hypothetical protein
MTTYRAVRCLPRTVRCLPLLALLGAALPSPGWAQPPAPSTEQMVQVDPIRCWWRTSAGAVRIGETFDLGLTCAVLENEMVQVVPDESRLGGAVIQMAPWEIAASSHPSDLRSGQRRFFQYQYTMRILNPDAVGVDVPIPIVLLHYRVNSKIAANASLQGRDLTYVLPPLTVRVLSMVTADSPDIRDSSGQSFSVPEELRLRAGVLEIAAITLAALGVLMIVVVLVRFVRGARKGTVAGERLLGDHAILARADRELSDVQRDAGQGWNESLAGRALAASRIAAACALDRPVSQGPSAPGMRTEGRLMTRRFLGRGAPITLSSAATSDDVARELARMSVDGDPVRRQTLEGLLTALTTFGQMQYGRETAADRGSLDAALSGAIASTRRLKSERMWPKRSFRRWTARAAQPEHQT